MIRMRELSGSQLGKRIDPTGGIVVDGTIALTTANADLDREKSFANVDYVRGAKNLAVTPKGFLQQYPPEAAIDLYATGSGCGSLGPINAC